MTVIVLFGGPASLAARSVTAMIPAVFVSGIDPVTFGLVDSLNRPGGNATGIYFLTASLEAKRLELLHELAPKVAVLGFLVNPNNPNAEALLRDTRQAARTLGLELHVLRARDEIDTSTAFESAVEQHIASPRFAPRRSAPRKVAQRRFAAKSFASLRFAALRFASRMAVAPSRPRH